MDLSAIQEILDNLATFGGAIGDFLQKPAQILGQLFGWFDGEGADIDDHAKTTSSLLSSSKEAGK
ncbi:PorH family porin [Corynebacterium cystitidis]|uniref:PorH family porin n=1 Tax=Corynebacterium cystitidis TaxID=35757 RepID=UPI00211F2CCB|nr:PorH family porin [Corynebacterium cystitidis]